MTDTMTPEGAKADLATENATLRAAARKAFNALYNLRQLYDFGDHDESVQRLLTELGDLTATTVKPASKSLPRHAHKPGPGMYPGICAECGYPASELAMHFARAALKQD